MPRKNLRIDSDLVKWFNEVYPNSSLSGTLSSLLRKYKEAHAGFTPELYERKAAQELLQDQ